MSGMARKWRVWFGGDPQYGNASVSEYRPQAEEVDAISGGAAAQKAMLAWRKSDAQSVKDEGWYEDGTRLYVQEVVDPPPVLVFVRSAGRMKKERT